jgi:hypothetical protein
MIDKGQKDWAMVNGTSEPGMNGCYTDRLEVPGGWLYRVEEWATGGISGRLEHHVLCFVPKPKPLSRRKK